MSKQNLFFFPPSKMSIKYNISRFHFLFEQNQHCVMFICNLKPLNSSPNPFHGFKAPGFISLYTEYVMVGLEQNEVQCCVMLFDQEKKLLHYLRSNRAIRWRRMIYVYQIHTYALFCLFIYPSVVLQHQNDKVNEVELLCTNVCT